MPNWSGGSSAWNGGGDDLVSGIDQLVVAGGAAGAKTVTGIKTTDKLISVLAVSTTTGELIDRTSSATITAVDTITMAGATTAGSNLLITFARSN